MVRNIVATLAAPLVWGLVGLPLNQLILALFPSDTPQSLSTAYLLCSLLASFVYSLLAGAAAARVAHAEAERTGLFAGLAVLAVGLGVQIGNWTLFPVWYHLIFLVALMPGCQFGARLIQSRRSLS